MCRKPNLLCIRQKRLKQQQKTRYTSFDLTPDRTNQQE